MRFELRHDATGNDLQYCKRQSAMKAILEYAGALSGFCGMIMLLFGWARHREALDFLFDLVFKGQISPDWDAAVLLIVGVLLWIFAAWTGVWGPHNQEDAPKSE